MRRNSLRFLLIGGVLAVVAGCSTGGQSSTRDGQPTKYTSLYHLYVSERDNSDGSRSRVTPVDVTTARHEEWRGKPITVSQDQIVER